MRYLKRCSTSEVGACCLLGRGTLEVVNVTLCLRGAGGSAGGRVGGRYPRGVVDVEVLEEGQRCLVRDFNGGHY